MSKPSLKEIPKEFREIPDIPVEVAPKIDYKPFPCSFDGEEGIKPPGTNIDYSPQMLQEFYKCARDPLYFIANYYYIVDLDKGLVQIDLFDYQKELVQHVHNNRFSIVFASRQVGKTIISGGYILWYLLFNDYKEIAVLSKTGPDANDIMRKLKRSYKAIPQWLQQNIVKWNTETIELENGSKVFARCTTEDAGRSAAANILFLDEFAFVPTNIAQSFYTSAYPIISNSKTSKVIICSTPNGYNHFYVMYSKALKHENFYKPYIIYWWQFPGRDEQWKKQTIANLSMEEGIDGEAKFAQEFDLQFDNVSMRALISSDIQKRISDHILNDVNEIKLEEFQDIENLSIFEDVQKGYVYFIACDTGSGVGSDNCAASVIKIERGKYRQIATFYDNYISTIEFAELINKLSLYYNNAYLLIENNGIGISTVEHLWYVLDTSTLITIDKNGLGVKMTKPFRAKGIIKLKEYLKYDTLEINDFRALQEISKFTQNLKTKKFEAEAGSNDDFVMGLVIFSHFASDLQFDSFLDGNSSGGVESINALIKEKIKEDNPFIMNYDKILQSNVVNLVTSEDFRKMMPPRF